MKQYQGETHTYSLFSDGGGLSSDFAGFGPLVGTFHTSKRKDFQYPVLSDELLSPSDTILPWKMQIQQVSPLLVLVHICQQQVASSGSSLENPRTPQGFPGKAPCGDRLHIIPLGNGCFGRSSTGKMPKQGPLPAPQAGQRWHRNVCSKPGWPEYQCSPAMSWRANRKEGTNPGTQKEQTAGDELSQQVPHWNSERSPDGWRCRGHAPLWVPIASRGRNTDYRQRISKPCPFLFFISMKLCQPSRFEEIWCKPKPAVNPHVKGCTSQAMKAEKELSFSLKFNSCVSFRAAKALIKKEQTSACL